MAGRKIVPSLLSSLVRPVVRAFGAAGFDAKELLTGPLAYTDLMWQAPPLMSEATLGGVPFHVYMGRHVTVNVQRLYAFWDEALLHMRHHPGKVIKGEGYVQTSYALPRSTAGERHFWFSYPEGFPSNTSDFAAVTLSLECASLLRNNVPVVEVVEDEDSYYVVLAEGHQVGVKGGLPILHSDQWDLPVNGLVPELLGMPRGEPFVGCDYDLISKLRSALWERREDFPEFDGVDIALQAMRILADKGHIRELASAVSRLHVDKAEREHRLQLVEEAVRLSKVFTISDRARVKGIRSLLVPDVINATTFARRIYHYQGNIPPTFSRSALTKMQQGLEQLYEEEKARA